MMTMIFVVLRRILLGLISSVKGLLTNTAVFSVDFLLTVYNFITPDKPVGAVLPKGHPGYGGKWPQYVPPAEGDSRCSCPMMNAMSNHGACPTLVRPRAIANMPQASSRATGRTSRSAS